MKETYQHLYNGMLVAIEKCNVVFNSELEIAEECFWRAMEHWEKLKHMIGKEDFTNEKEEIDFFKNVKPKFTCQIEYYIKISRALLFIPEFTSKTCLLEFWKDESRLFQQFLTRNKEFIEYYLSGDTKNDKEYFARLAGEERNFSSLDVYDTDPAYSSLKDPLVRNWMAYELYENYIRLQKLSNTKE
jgi:hypothetical protein